MAPLLDDDPVQIVSLDGGACATGHPESHRTEEPRHDSDVCIVLDQIILVKAGKRVSRDKDANAAGQACRIAIRKPGLPLFWIVVALTSAVELLSTSRPSSGLLL